MLFKKGERTVFYRPFFCITQKIPPPSAFSAHGNNCKPPARNNRQPLLPTIIFFFFLLPFLVPSVRSTKHYPPVKRGF